MPKTRWIALLAIALFPCALQAQESRIASDLRREKEHIAAECDEFKFKALGTCAVTLFTASPLHIALGSLAPQNGTGFGIAFSERFTPNESWRLSWSTDAVTTASGSWRAGVYLKAIRTPDLGISVRPAGAPPGNTDVGPRPVPVFDFVAQTISLETISFYGIGPDSRRDDRTVYGERETIFGGSAIYPIPARGLRPLRPSLVGGLHARLIDLRPGQSGEFPSIEQRFDELTAPGLTEQDTFVQFTEGVRFDPEVANGALQLKYLLTGEQFRTSTATRGSFSRWTADLRHEIPLYGKTASTGGTTLNGPNECATSTTSTDCPPVQWSRNRQGTVTVRLLAIGTTTGDDNRVPFFLQPTLGGSDLNDNRRLVGYDDYRFRGPAMVLIQEGIEHSLWGPLGVFVLAEHGRVSREGEGISFTNLSHSASVGITLRAGGFPMVTLAFGFGGEANHVITSINATLLGGGGRPSLY